MIPEINEQTTARDREEWLGRGASIFETDVSFPTTSQLLPKFRISCGWPRSTRGKRDGYCYPATHSTDGTVETFVSPEISKPDEALACTWILAVRALRGATGNVVEFQHDLRRLGGGFADVASSADFGKLTTKTIAQLLASDDRFVAALEQLGPYPHAAFSPTLKTQSTRLLKVTCKSCDWTIRASALQANRLTGRSACPVCRAIGTFTINGCDVGA